MFDALTTVRRYKEAISRDDALAVMRAEEGHFDPRLLALFAGAVHDIDDIRTRIAEDSESAA